MSQHVFWPGSNWTFKSIHQFRMECLHHEGVLAHCTRTQLPHSVRINQGCYQLGRHPWIGPKNRVAMNQNTNSIRQFGMFQGEGMFFSQSSHIIPKPLVPLVYHAGRFWTALRSSGRIGVDQTPILGTQLICWESLTGTSSLPIPNMPIPRWESSTECHRKHGKLQSEGFAWSFDSCSKSLLCFAIFCVCSHLWFDQES